MKKAMIWLAALFVVLGLCAAVYAQAGGYGGPPPKTKICKPGAIPSLSHGQSQYFEAKSHFEAQCTCNRVAAKYKQYVCYAVKGFATVWDCMCKKTK